MRDRRQGLERRLSQPQGARHRRDGARRRSGPRWSIVVTPSDDHRSYHVSSEQAFARISVSWRARIVDDAIGDLKAAFTAGKVPNAMTDDRYYNIKRMQALKLQ